MKYLFQTVLVTTLLIVSVIAPLHSAEKTFGNYTIHYSAFNADFLSPSVAKAYDIQRSKNRGVLNVTVLKKTDAALPIPIQANVSGTAITVYQKARPLKIREIKDQNSFYYIAEFPVANEETLNFKISASSDDTDIGDVSFQQQFFTQ